MPLMTLLPRSLPGDQENSGYRGRTLRTSKALKAKIAGLTIGLKTLKLT